MKITSGFNLSPLGSQLSRHQQSHAPSCRHIHLGAPQAAVSAEFPLGHGGQPRLTAALAPHLPPVHHQTLATLTAASVPPPPPPPPATFQDASGPSFLPQALQQQYLLQQQQLLDTQDRRTLPHYRYHLSEGVTLRSHYTRPSTDVYFTYPSVFPGFITKEILLDSVFKYICITRSDCPTDPSLPEELNISQLFDTCNGADRTDRPTMHFESAPCKVNEIRQRTDAHAFIQSILQNH